MKKLLSFLFLYLMAVTVAQAITFEVDGIYYNLISANDKTCEVTPCGGSYSTDKKYSGPIHIPAKVVYNGQELTVLNIQEYSFIACVELTELTLPSTIREIGRSAFANTPKLETLTIPGSVSLIGSGALTNCGIKEIRFEAYQPWGEVYHSLDFGSPSEGVNRVRLFDDLPNLEKVYVDRTLPVGSQYPSNSVTYPFSDIQTIKEVEMGPNLRESVVFKNCPALEKATLPATPGFILSGYTFQFCRAIKEIKNFEYVTTFRASCLSGVALDLKINPATEYIGENAFYGTGITNVELTNPALNIDANAFGNCQQLENITINSNSLGYYMFMGCEGIKNVTFGPNVTSGSIPRALGVKDSNYYNMVPVIENLNMMTPEPPTCSSEFPDEIYINTTLHVLPGSLEAYKNARIWKNFWNIQGDQENGINDTMIDDANISIFDGMIVMPAVDGEGQYTVYGTNGKCMFMGKSGSLYCPEGGVFIIKTPSGKISKVMVP